jgi:hypothetical protein
MTTGRLNLYGDTLVSTTGAHGGDIAGQRLDELDTRALHAVLDSAPTKPVGVEFGCGFGWQGARFALLGARMHLYDLLPPSALLCALQAEPALELRYWQSDLAELAVLELPPSIDFVFSQRTIHYLRFEAALGLMAMTASRMEPGAPCDLSVSGIGSELGEGYADAALPVEQRFAVLAEPMRGRHGIGEPVCLYAADDLEALMAAAGFDAERIWMSPFGNVKGIFRRSSV